MGRHKSKRATARDLAEIRLGLTGLSNPLIEGWEFHVSEYQSRNIHRRRRDGSYEPALQYGERLPNVRLLASSELTDLLMTLSHPGLKVWVYILGKLESGHDIFCLDRVLVMAKCDIGERAFEAACRELEKLRLIYRISVRLCGRRDVFFIHPKYAFVGNRRTAFPNNTKIRRSKNDEDIS